MAQARPDVGGSSTQKRRREQERRRSFLERASDYLRNVLPQETLSRGAVGESVRRLQQILGRIGYDVGPDDGVFGPRTERALRAFQRGVGLEETGVYSPREREALARVVQAPERVGDIAGGTGLLRLGSRGEAVRDLQTRLRELGFDPGPIDGVFGPRTAAAVRAFQESVGIRPDAVVGPVTRSAMATISEQRYRERVADVRRRLQARRPDEDVVGQPTRRPEQAQKRPRATPDGVPDASAELSPAISEALRRLVSAQEVRKPSDEVERENPLVEFGEQILYGAGRALMLPELIAAYRSATGQPTRPEDVFEAPEGTAERIGDFIGQVLGQLGFFLATGPVGGALSLGGRMLGRAGLQAATKGLARAGARELAESQAARTLGEALRRLAPVAEGAYEAAIRGGLYGAYQQAARELAVPDEADFAQRLQNALRTAGYFGAYGAAYQVARPVVGRIGQEIGRRAPALQRAAETIAQRSPLASELTRGAAEGGLAGTLVGLGQAGVGVATGQPVQAAVAQVPQEAREEISENIVEAIALRLAQILGGRLGAAPVAPTQPAQQEQAAQRVAPQQTEQPAPQPQATTPPQQTVPEAPQQAERPVPQPQAATPPQQPTSAAPQQQPVPRVPGQPTTAPQQQPTSRVPEQPTAQVPSQPQVPPAGIQQPEGQQQTTQAPEGQRPQEDERAFAGPRPVESDQGPIPTTDFGELGQYVEYVPVKWLKKFKPPKSYDRVYVGRAARDLANRGFQKPIEIIVGRNDGRALVSDDKETALQLAAAERLGLQEVPVIVRVQDTVDNGKLAYLRLAGEGPILRPSEAFEDLPPTRQTVRPTQAQQVVPQQQAPTSPEQAPSVPARPDQSPAPATSVQAETQQQETPVEERPSLRVAQAGAEEDVLTPAGTRVRVQYAVVDADDLITSHTTNLAPDPRYPQDLQPRDRSRAASESQIQSIAANLTPDLLGRSPTAVDGAPVVGPDGVVESGNGRTIALKRVYENPAYEAQRNAYRRWLEEHAADFGLDPEAVRAVAKPVLVRVRTSDVDRVRFTREANVSTVASMSATERAMADAERITPTMLDLLNPEAEGDITAVANRDFVREFMATIPENEHGTMLLPDGRLSQEGVNRIRNAILAKAYGNPALLQRLTEDPDDNIRNVSRALLMTAPRLVQFRAGVQRRDYWPELDIADEIAAAANKLAQLREQGQSVKEYVAQTGLFTDLSPLARRILEVYDRFKRSPRNIAAVFDRYLELAEAAGSPDQVGLFGAEAPDPEALLEAAMQKVEDEASGQAPGQQSIFGGRSEAQAGAGAEGTGVSVPAREAGAQVPDLPRGGGEVRRGSDGRESEQQPAGQQSRKRRGEGKQEAPRTQERKAPARKQERQTPAVKPNPEVEQAVAGKDIAVLDGDDVHLLSVALPHLSKVKSLTLRTDVRMPRSLLASIRQALRGWEVYDNGDGTITFIPPDHVAQEVSAFYDAHGVRPWESVQWAEFTAHQALTDMEGTAAAVAADTLPRGATGSGARLLALGIRTDLVRQGYVDFRGKQVRSPADLAALAQVVRDPRFETLRIFYVKGDTIVGQEAITSRLPNAVMFWPREVWPKQRERIRRRMERLGADGFYVLHNHPSGHAEPSEADILLTQRLAQTLPGFRGHVVIDSGHYAVIQADGEVFLNDLGDWTSVDELLRPAVDHPLLGIRIYDPDTVARLGRAIYFDLGESQASMPVLIYTDVKHRVRAIQQVPEGLFSSAKHAGDYIRGRAREFGSPHVFLFHTRPLDDGVLAKLIKEGVLLDAVHSLPNTSRFISLRQLGVVPDPRYTLGLRDEHYVVREEPDDLVDVASFFADVAKKAPAQRRPRAQVRLTQAFQQLELPISEIVDRAGKPTPQAVINEEKQREIEAAAAGIIEARPDVKAPRVPDVLSEHPDIAAPLMPHQREGVNLAMQALKTGPRGFFLADGTGAGKTMQGLAIAMMARRQGAQRVLILTEREKIVDDAWLKDVQRFGPELARDVRKWKPGLEKEPGIYVSWYHQLNVKRPIPTEGWDLVIFDEAHALKNVLKKTARALQGLELERNTPQVVYMSATPVDRPTDFRYFGHRLGLFADDETSFDEWVLRLGLQPRYREVRNRRTGRTTIQKDYVRLPGVTWEDVAGLIDEQMAELKRQGRMIKREVPLEGLDVIISYRPLDPEAERVQDLIIREFGGENARGLKRAQQITLLRRHLENFKIPHAVELARKELAEGRQVVIFAGYKEESAAEKPIFMGTLYGGEPFFVWETIHKSESVIKRLREELEKIVGEGNVAELHGGVKGEKKPDVNAEIQAYQSGKKKVAIATLEMASTGVSLHDETGRAPRTQIMLTLPWSAMQHVQAAGRSHRLTSKSKTRLYVLTTDSEIDNLLTSVLAAKMKVLKATVRGDLDRIDIAEGEKRLDFPGSLVRDEIGHKLAGEPEVEVGVSPSTAMDEDVDDIDAMIVDDGSEGDLDALIPRRSRKQEQQPAQKQDDPYAMAPQTRREIIKFVMDKLGPYVGTGRLRVKKALGQYDRRQEVIRLKYAEDLPALMHELGHYFDDKLGLRRRAGRYAEELISLGEATSPEGASVGYRFKEGIAQFLRFWVTGEQDVRLLAPGFNKFWEQLLEANPEFKETMERLRDMTRAYLSLPPVEKVRRSISFAPLPKERPTMSQALWSFFEQAYKMMVDNLYPLQKLTMALSGGNPLPITKDPGRLAALMRGHLGKVEAWLYKGQFTFRNDTLEQLGPSLAEILKPVSKTKEDLEDFITYAVAKVRLEYARVDREINKKRAEQGLPPLPMREFPFSEEEAKEVVRSLETPEREKALRQLTEYRRNLTRELEAAGIIPEGRVDEFEKMYRYNLPFYREMDVDTDEMAESRRGTGRTFADLPRVTLRLRGSSRTIINPLHSLIRDTYFYLNLAHRNRVMLTAVDLARKTKGMGKLIEVDLPPKAIPFKRDLVNMAEILRAELEKAGSAFDPADPVDWEAIFKALEGRSIVEFRTSYQKGGREAKEHIVVYMEGGQPKFARVDREVYQALLGLDVDTSPLWARLMGADLVRLFRSGVTMAPEFIARNVFRDVFSTMVFSEAGINPVDWVRGLFSALRRDDLYWKWKASGGSRGEMTTFDRDSLAEALKDIADLKQPSMSRRMLSASVAWVRRILEATEAAGRIAEFDKNLRKIARKKKGALTEADYLEAAERSRMQVNVDFARAGTVTRELNRVVPFYNAAVQEIDLIARSFVRHPWRTFFRAVTYITLPTLLLYLLNRDDENYWELPQWRRDLFWNIPLGNGYFVSLPIPFLMGALFKTVPERIFQWIDRNDPKALDELGRTLAEAGAPGTILSEKFPIPLPIPHLFLGMLELYANRRTFSSVPIVPERELRLPPELQYGPYTPETAKIIGRWFGLSPRKVDYFFAAYGGSLGQGVLRGVDFALEKLGLVKPVPRPQDVKGMWFVGDFVTDELASSLDRFYRDFGEAETRYNGYRAMLEQGQRVDITRQEFAQLYQRVQLMRRVSRRLSDLRKLQRRVLAHPTMTPEQKAEALRQIELEMTNLVRYAYGKRPLKK